MYINNKFEMINMISRDKSQPDEVPISKEEEIFKLLTHQTRRDIIKVLGERDLTFSQIKKKLEIESPTLSYHLKSMKEFVIQKKSKYTFSDIGRAALLLLTKTDQSIKVSKYRRNLWYIYIVSYVCWVLIGFLVPVIIVTTTSIHLQILIILIFVHILAVINMSVIGFLKSRYV